MFNYPDIEYRDKIFRAYDLIQFDVEKNLPVFLKKKNKEVSNIVIVGAWHGDEIKSFLKFPNAEIFAFEANPKIFSDLKKIYQHEKRVCCFNYACAEKSGVASFFETNLVGNGSLLEIDWSHSSAKQTQSFNVETVSLDAVGDLKNKKIDLLWIDVQGAELLVLNGAKELLKNVDMIFIEISKKGSYYKNAVKLEELVSFINNYGFYQAALGLDSNGDGNAIFLKNESDALLYKQVNERIHNCVKDKLMKVKLYENFLFKIILRLTPTRIKLLLKKIINKIF